MRFIQSKLKSPLIQVPWKTLAEKLNAALRLLSESKSCDILLINEDKKQLLKEKHTSADEHHDELTIEGPEFRFNEDVYENLSGSFEYWETVSMAILLKPS